MPVVRLHPKKSLGQNFLRDENIVHKIIAAIDPRPEDNLLEIGPGEGALTRYLVGCGRSLTVVDLDGRAVAAMRKSFPRGVEIIQGDFLLIDLADFARRHPGRVRVVGNLPYNITSPILFHVLDNRLNVTDLTIMVQKEVGMRMAAQPGTTEYGILSVFCNYYAQVELLFEVSPNVFFPRPKVDSAVMHLNMRSVPLAQAHDEQFFRAMVRSVFGKRRKTLRNSLRYFAEEMNIPVPGIPALGRRPEELSVQELVELSNMLLRSMSFHE